ncbi:MAG: aminotransferase class I/II-fold pyridoxal phosphate-dependent enzyme [Chloroflexi bacterium]|nr:aminotransferase class I/II-fold pyridoxal phosphate-dependent enzyme [Chloroflexota bacterium]
MQSIATDIQGIPSSGIREMQSLGLAIPDAIHLEIGDPDFNTPLHVREAAEQAMRDGWTRYSATTGLLSLRERLSAKLRDRNQIEASPQNILVTAGSTSGLAITIRAITEAGDDVLIPDPGWPNYYMMCVGARVNAIRYQLPPAQGFVPDTTDLDKLVTPRTKAILINSPSNPTGAVFSQSVLEALLEFALRHDLYVIADEVYEEIIFEGQHVSPSTLSTDGRVISLFSFSKTYAMTGWRLGYLVASDSVIANCTKVQEGYVACASTIAQRAAEVAISGPQDCVREMRAAYQRRRDLACDLLIAHGARFYRPNGAFYLMLDVSDTGPDDLVFCKSLLRRQKVALAPGSTFGETSRGWVRLSLAASEESIRTGLQRAVAELADLRVSMR